MKRSKWVWSWIIRILLMVDVLIPFAVMLVMRNVAVLKYSPMAAFSWGLGVIALNDFTWPASLLGGGMCAALLLMPMVGFCFLHKRRGVYRSLVYTSCVISVGIFVLGYINVGAFMYPLLAAVILVDLAFVLRGKWRWYRWLAYVPCTAAAAVLVFGIVSHCVAPLELGYEVIRVTAVHSVFFGLAAVALDMLYDPPAIVEK